MSAVRAMRLSHTHGEPRLPVDQAHTHGRSLSVRAREQPGTLVTLLARAAPR